MTDRHRPGTAYSCDARNYGADKRLCPVHAHAHAMLALLAERPTVSLSGQQYTDFTAWQDRVDVVLRSIGGEG